MLISLDYILSNQLLIVDIAGEKSYQTLEQALHRVISHSKEKATILRLLIIDRSEICITISEVYKLTVLFIDQLVTLNISRPRIALLKLSIMDEEFKSFLETVSQNRGLDMQVFTNEQRARDWLSLTRN